MARAPGLAFLVVLVAASAACARPNVCRKTQTPPALDVPTPSPGTGFMTRAHAHNDYEHPRPLLDALDQGFYSVEVDVWWREGRVVVSHDVFSDKGTLLDLYLRPLAERLFAQDSVHGDGETFYLWIDLKQGSDELRQALHRELESFDFFSEFTQHQVKRRAVTAILTGDAGSKTRYGEERFARLASRDSNDFDLDDPPADSFWRYYALNWGKYISWDGEGEIEDDERERLSCLVENAHRLGRRLRFWSAPDTEAFWDLALDAGLDFINTDKLEELAAHLQKRAEEAAGDS